MKWRKKQLMTQPPKIGWTSKPMKMTSSQTSGSTSFTRKSSEKDVLKMPNKKFEVITRDYPLNKRKGFNNLEDAYSYYKKLPKHVQKESHIWFGHEVLV